MSPRNQNSRHTMLSVVMGVGVLGKWEGGFHLTTCPLSTQQFGVLAAPGCSDCTRWPAVKAPAHLRSFFGGEFFFPQLICHVSKKYIKKINNLKFSARFPQLAGKTCKNRKLYLKMELLWVSHCYQNVRLLFVSPTMKVSCTRLLLSTWVLFRCCFHSPFSRSSPERALVIRGQNTALSRTKNK